MGEDGEANFLDFLDELDEIAPLKEPPRVERPPPKPAPVRQRYVPQESSEDEEEEDDEEEEGEDAEEKVVGGESKTSGPGTFNPTDHVPEEVDDQYKFLALHPATFFQPPRRADEHKAPPPTKNAATSSAASTGPQAPTKPQRQNDFSGKAPAIRPAQDAAALPSYSDLLASLDEEDAEETQGGQTNPVTPAHGPAVSKVREAVEPRERAPATKVPVAPKPQGGRRSTAGAPPTATSMDTFDLKAELKTVPARPQPDWKKEKEAEKDDQSLEAILARLDREEQEDNAQQVWDSFKELSQVEGHEIQSADAANLPGLLGPSMKALTGPLVKVQQEQSLAEKEEFEFQAPDEDYLAKIEERRVRLMERDKAKRAARDAKLAQRVQKAIDRERSGGVRSVIPPAQRSQRIGLAPLKPMGLETNSRAQTGTDVLDEIFNVPKVPRIKPSASSQKRT